MVHEMLRSMIFSQAKLIASEPLVDFVQACNSYNN